MIENWIKGNAVVSALLFHRALLNKRLENGKKNTDFTFDAEQNTAVLLCNESEISWDRCIE